MALAEAHDSGIADDLIGRRYIASDLDNLTIAKSDREPVAGEWVPCRLGAWVRAQVIAVKLEYGLSVESPRTASPKTTARQ